MKLSKKVLQLLKKDTALRLHVALSLGISEQGIKKNIANNSSTLTKIAAIRTIQKETGLTENQILVTQKATA